MLKPNRDVPAFTGRIAVLTGPVIMSSAESLLLLMKQVPGCKLVGARSYGSSGNPRPIDLGNGVTVMLPRSAKTVPRRDRPAHLWEAEGLAGLA